MTENQKLAMVVVGGIGLTAIFAVRVSPDLGDVVADKIKDMVDGNGYSKDLADILVDNTSSVRLDSSFVDYAF